MKTLRKNMQNILMKKVKDFNKEISEIGTIPCPIFAKAIKKVYCSRIKNDDC